MEIKITTEFIKLQQALKFAGLVNMGSDAKAFILDEKVKVNGEVCTIRGKKLRAGDSFEFDGKRVTVT
ncbi:MAG: RNA-binding S4 domain-containing protein [Ruminococcus sp.]|jgi:ribosome-associated protein|nr:RNA-binding S4 domain-containing protein [Ruminococcus sp.]